MKIFRTTIITLCMFFSLAVCVASVPQAVRASDENRDVDPFHSVVVSGGISMTFTKGPASVMVEGVSSKGENLVTEVKDSVLKISLMEDVWNGPEAIVKVSAPVIRMLTADSGAQVKLSGRIRMPEDLILEANEKSVLRADDAIVCPRLTVKAENSGSIYVGDINTQLIRCSATDNASVVLEGHAIRGFLSAEKGSTIDAVPLTGNKMTVLATGNSVVGCNPMVRLEKDCEQGSLIKIGR